MESLSLPLAGPMPWPKQILRGQEKQREVSCFGFFSYDFLAVSANLLIKIDALQIERCWPLEFIVVSAVLYSNQV